MIIQNIDGISFEMKEACDFPFLSKYGEVFCVFAQNDSGNISFGVDNGKQRYFVKIAGAKTARLSHSAEEAVQTLKAAMPIYKDLAHPNLIQLIECFEYEELYVAVFNWANGECLFDHWNFEMYAKNPSLVPPRQRFKELPCKKRLNTFNVLFGFLALVESKGYTAIDFYDGSIMYDFEWDRATICDIDFFKKNPVVNDMGADFWGTKRLKSPEEYILNAKIDSVTNVFTIGALLFHFFSTYSDSEIKKMYKDSIFSPCKYETWELGEASYKAALKAVSPKREDRYASIKLFFDDWKTLKH